MLETIITQSHIRLRMLREAFTLNKSQFSKLIDIPYRTYIIWERIDRRISHKAIINLISLGINPAYIDGDNHPILSEYSFEFVKKNIMNKMIEKGIK